MKTKLAGLLLLISTSLFAQTDTLHSRVYRWSTAPVKQSATGERRDVLKGKTLDLAGFDIHTSTLMPGLTNHPLVAYNDREELVVVKEGELKVSLNDTSKVIGPGSIVFITEGDRQSFQNTSASPVTYYVITFRSKVPNTAPQVQSAGLIMEWKDLVVKTSDKGESRPMFIKPTPMFKKFDIHATALNPGFSSHAPHTHRAEELILMIKGSGEMLIGSTPHEAQSGDAILLGANVPHAFTNTGKEQCGYFAIQWNN